MGIVKRFPKSWRVDVIVLRNGGRDPKGNPRPDEEIPLKDCLIGPRLMNDPVDHSDVSASELYLYRDPDPEFRFRTTDRIRVPSGARMAGDWSVDGRPKEWPLGVEVGLEAG